MKGDRESPATIHFSGDLTVLLTEADDESDLSKQNIQIKEELIEEVMQDLCKEISSSSSTSLLPTFSSPSLPFDITSDSCGASVSDTASTVMAGVELVRAVGVENLACGRVGSPPIENTASSWVLGLERAFALRYYDDGDCKKMDGCDGGKVGDEWLARVLSWDSLELEKEWDLN